MFTFEELDGMSRLVMLKKQKETKDYWRQMYRLKGAFILWGTQTSVLINQIELESQDDKLKRALGDAAVRGEITVTKLANLLKRLDVYLMEMDTRLGDGTKWNTAAEISKLFDEQTESRSPDAS